MFILLLFFFLLKTFLLFCVLFPVLIYIFLILQRKADEQINWRVTETEKLKKLKDHRNYLKMQLAEGLSLCR